MGLWAVTLPRKMLLIVAHDRQMQAHTEHYASSDKFLVQGSTFNFVSELVYCSVVHCERNVQY